MLSTLWVICGLNVIILELLGKCLFRSHWDRITSLLLPSPWLFITNFKYLHVHLIGIRTVPDISDIALEAHSNILQNAHSNILNLFPSFWTWSVSILLTTPISLSNCWRSKRWEASRYYVWIARHFGFSDTPSPGLTDCPHTRLPCWNNRVPQHTGFWCFCERGAVLAFQRVHTSQL